MPNLRRNKAKLKEKQCFEIRKSKKTKESVSVCELTHSNVNQITRQCVTYKAENDLWVKVEYCTVLWLRNLLTHDRREGIELMPSEILCKIHIFEKTFWGNKLLRKIAHSIKRKTHLQTFAHCLNELKESYGKKCSELSDSE